METIEQIADKYVLELDTAQYTETTIKDAFLAGYDYGRKDIVLTDKKPEDLTLAEISDNKRRAEWAIVSILNNFCRNNNISDFEVNITQDYYSRVTSAIAKIEVKIK